MINGPALWAGLSEDRNPVEARISTPVLTSPEGHPSSYVMITGYFSGVKGARCGAEHPCPTSDVVREKVEVYFYSLFGPSWPVKRSPLTLPVPNFIFPSTFRSSKWIFT
jgi:hypothetical protein